MFLDIKLGILWSFLVGLVFGVTFSPWWFLAGIVCALLPDIDFWIEYVQRGTVGGKVLGAHRTLLHNPLLYVPIAFFIGAQTGEQWMALFVFGVFGHLIHDSMGMGFGVRWLWPFSGNFYKIFSDKEGNIFYDWKHARPLSWTPREAAEVIREKGNDNWLSEDVRYHVKRWPMHLFRLGFLLLFLLLVLAYFEE